MYLMSIVRAFIPFIPFIVRVPLLLKIYLLPFIPFIFTISRDISEGAREGREVFEREAPEYKRYTRYKRPYANDQENDE